MDVLLPECVVRIVADVHRVSFDEVSCVIQFVYWWPECYARLTRWWWATSQTQLPYRSISHASTFPICCSLSPTHSPLAHGQVCHMHACLCTCASMSPSFHTGAFYRALWLRGDQVQVISSGSTEHAPCTDDFTHGPKPPVYYRYTPPTYYEVHTLSLSHHTL